MPARSAQGYLHIASGRWQWRIDDIADVQIRHAVTHEIIRSFTPAQVVLMGLLLEMNVEMVAESLERRAPQQIIRREVASAPSRTATRALGVPLRPVQEARRAARAKNSTHKGRKRRDSLPS